MLGILIALIKEFYGVSGKQDIDEEIDIFLMNYDYPGNIRELRSTIQSTVNLARGKQIFVDSFPPCLRKRKSVTRSYYQEKGNSIVSLEVEKAHVLKTYEHTGRIKTQMAKLLSIGLNTLRRKLEAYGVA